MVACFVARHLRVELSMHRATSSCSVTSIPRPETARDRPDFRFKTWVVIKIMVPFWVLSIIRHLVFSGPKKGPEF